MAVSSDLDVTCAWQHAFNVAPNRRGPFGYLLEWSGLGGLVLGKDIVVWNPLGGAGQSLLGGATVSCVGIIERFQFGGDVTDPIRVSCFLSQENQTNLRAKLARPLVNTKVRMSWSVVGYDDAAKAWFESIDLLDPKWLDGLVNTVDGALQIDVDGAPTSIGEDEHLQVYRFEVEVVPPPNKLTTLQFALGQNQRIVAAWGEAA
ncbi:MAG TPA: hypothetical protein VKB80_13070 [Kofleriaceae bacterium]|nr:hypothetical protein [Kofleriaceae bacterium]